MAGHVAGGLELVEPGRVPHDLPAFAGGAVHSPLAWYEALSDTLAPGGACGGFRGALARVTGEPRRVSGTTSVIDLRGGSFGFDDNSVQVDRRDSLVWLRAEAYSSRRLAAGALDQSGRHLWGAAGGARRGAHEFAAAFAQRGAATRLLGSEEESHSARSGSVTWRGRWSRWTGGAGFARGTAHAESFADFYDLSRRDADEMRLDASLAHDAGVDARIEYGSGRVSRTVSEDDEWRARSLWGAVRWRREVEDGEVVLELGAGRHGTRDGVDWAPAAWFRTGAGRVRARAGVERVLHAVWSDLGGGEPFLQRTWAGVLEVDADAGPLRGGRVSFLGGRTTGRAVMTRVPNTEFALRTGVVPDPEPWAFGLLRADGRWTFGRVGVGGEGFALWRPDHLVQPRVDPGFGARAWARSDFAWFGGDLGVGVQLGAVAVGPREVESEPGRFAPGYVTNEALGRFTLADALISVRVRNLENVAREQPWIDFLTGEPALGPGREWRFAVTLLLQN